MKQANGKLSLLPDPGEDLDGEDAGEILGPDEPGPEDLAPEDDYDLPDWLTDPGPAPGPEPEPERVIPIDKPAGRLREKQRPPKGAAEPVKPVRVTAAIRKDIHAKVQIGLHAGGLMWQSRDAYCGGALLEQEDPIADAFTRIICDSPDLVNWFTGPAGGFMKWFDLIMACLPVAAAVGQHHLRRGGQVPADPNLPPQQPAPSFAA